MKRIVYFALHTPWLLPGVALLLLLPVGCLILSNGFNGLYGQDAYAYFDYATGPLRESLRAPAPFPPFQWPPGYPLLIALLSFVVGAAPAAGQLVSLASGALAPVFTALLAKEIGVFGKASQIDGRPATAASYVVALAGLFVALNGHLWQPSLVVMSDATALAAGTAGMWALARYGNRRQGQWLVLAAAALAFALFTRVAYVLVLVPAGVVALILLSRQPRRQALRHALPALLVAAVILLPIAWPMLTALFDPQQGTLPFAATGQIYKWNPLTILRRVHVSADGVLRYTLPNGLFYTLTPARAFYFSPLIAVFILPGLWAALRRGKPVSLLFLVGWPAAVVLFHAGTPWQSFRFTLVYLPPLAILAAIGVGETFDFLGKRPFFQKSSSLGGLSFLTLMMGAWLLAGLVWMTIGGYRYTNNFIETAQASVETARWAADQVPPDAHLVTFGLTLTLEHESDLEVHEIFFMTPADLAALLTDKRPVYLLLDVNGVESQWVDRAPSHNYYWLRDGPGLIQIGRRGQYTLFAVGQAANSR